MPEVSIILPCYNVEKYIAKSIQSVLDQTYGDFELLVVIDGSPDNSKIIAESFTDKRITIYEKPNGGLSDARNYGLVRAKGEYVYFMDSDDWIESDLIEKTINVLENKKLDLVIFGYFQDDENIDGALINSQTIIPNSAPFKKTERAVILEPHIIGLLGYAWNKVYRRSFLLDNKLVFEKSTSLVEDILFNSQVYQKTDVLHFINEAFYHYLNRPSATLIKQFHKDSFQLKLRKNEALKQFFKNWYVQNSADILAFSQIHGIRYCIHNMFHFKNDLTFNEKTAYIKNMIKHPFTKSIINNYSPKNSKDKIYKVLIKRKQAFIISLLALLIK
ncbi:MAG: glycosyltransferase family 2 protein [Psychroflexus halocasei]